MIAPTEDIEVRITEQPDAAPGYEWLYEIPIPHHPSIPAAYMCGTASTREEVVKMANDLIRYRRAREFNQRHQHWSHVRFAT